MSVRASSLLRAVFPPLFFGALFIAVTLFLPQGVVGLLRRGAGGRA